MKPYSLRPVETTADEWDRGLSAYPTRTLFHSSSWLAMLQETTGGRLLRFEVLEGERRVGLFSGLLVRKGPFLAFGSPLPGWGTPVMGPVADPASFDQRAFLQATTAALAGRGAALGELVCPWMDPGVLQESGFRAAPDVTFRMDLTTVHDAWRALQSRTRTYVHKAERAGLVVEAAREESAVDEHYQQLLEVFAKWRSRPPYGRERPAALWRHLHPHSLTVLRVLHEGRCIATYVLAWDQDTMWGLSSASRQNTLTLRPNDLMHWHAIRMACEKGLRHFDFCGGGDYKSKYGGTLQPRVRWIHSRSLLASAAYRVAETAWFAKREATLALAKLLRR